MTILYGVIGKKDFHFLTYIKGTLTLGKDHSESNRLVHGLIMSNHAIKFHKDLISGFRLIPLTDKLTDKQSDGHAVTRAKTNTNRLIGDNNHL